MHQLNQRVPAPTTSRGLPLRSAPRSQPVLALNSRAWPTSAPLPRRGIGRVTLRWVIRVDESCRRRKTRRPVTSRWPNRHTGVVTRPRSMSTLPRCLCRSAADLHNDVFSTETSRSTPRRHNMFDPLDISHRQRLIATPISTPPLRVVHHRDYAVHTRPRGDIGASGRASRPF